MRLHVTVLLLSLSLGLTEGQLDFGVFFRFVRGKAEECFSSRLQRTKVMTKTLSSILKGDLEQQSAQLKCTSKCFMESFGVLDPNGGILPSTLRRLLEEIPVAYVKNLALDRLDTCVDDAEDIDDMCQKSASVIMCITRNGLLLVSDLPQTLLTGVKIIQRVVAARILAGKDSSTEKPSQ